MMNSTLLNTYKNENATQNTTETNEAPATPTVESDTKVSRKRKRAVSV
jgi:hypothetical protein